MRRKIYPIYLINTLKIQIIWAHKSKNKFMKMHILQKFDILSQINPACQPSTKFPKYTNSNHIVWHMSQLQILKIKSMIYLNTTLNTTLNLIMQGNRLSNIIKVASQIYEILISQEWNKSRRIIPKNCIKMTHYRQKRW